METKLSPDDFLAHARDVLHFSEEKIKKNFYAITTGRFYSVNQAHLDNDQRRVKVATKAARTDAEKAAAKAKHGGDYSTAACVAWRKSLGYEILAIEVHGAKGFKRDIYGGWDVLSFKDGRLYVDQAFGPGGYSSHKTKLYGSRAVEKARKIKAVAQMHEFHRGEDVPRRSWDV